VAATRNSTTDVFCNGALPQACFLKTVSGPYILLRSCDGFQTEHLRGFSSAAQYIAKPVTMPAPTVTTVIWQSLG
jgi:hypothetical protein